MSYLATPRLHFSGYFQSDVSTVNNDVRHFDSAAFKPSYQLPQTDKNMNGWWNPEGTAAFRLVGVTVTGGQIGADPLEGDPAFGLTLAGADGRVCGKMVDLDPQQQSVSEIWGLEVRLTDDSNKHFFVSDYRVAPFMDLWRRQSGSTQGDQTLASQYQSVLENVVWSDTANSPLLDALARASSNGLLSIKFNVFGYKLDSTAPDFTLGRIIGTIGAASQDEPATFSLGRHMMADLSQVVTPDQGIYNFQCVVDDEKKTVTADLGNALPIVDGDGKLANVGELHFAVLKSDSLRGGADVEADDVEIIGPVDYQTPGWYDKTAGIVTLSYADHAGVKKTISDHPLALVVSDGNDYRILIRESVDGLYVRADQFVHRLNPGEAASVDLYATQYGRPLSSYVQLSANNAMIGGGGSGKPLKPPVPIPTVGMPNDAIAYPPTIQTDDAGKASFDIRVSEKGPGTPRKYISNQVYGIGYQISSLPTTYLANPWLFVSVLAFDRLEIPDAPTWHDDIKPILTQYGNLYPIMSKHLVDLADYDSVVAHSELLQLAFGLPIPDPNYMPVTRDMSAAQTKMLLQWFDNPGSDGKPLKGEADAHVKPSGFLREETTEGDDSKARLGGKTAYLHSLKQK